MPGFVDVHTHVIPSGDDGARDLAEGLELCRLAAEHGTTLLFGTPHAQPGGRWHALTPERRRRAIANHEAMRDECAGFGLELRLGWEVAPTGLVGEVEDYVLEGTDVVLVEFPGPWFAFPDPLETTRLQVEEVRAAGFGVVLAHPERCVEIQEEPARAHEFASDDVLFCFNADSFVGGHGEAAERCAWALLELGIGDLVASDAHRLTRPSRLHEAVEAVAPRFGRKLAHALADGSALGLVEEGRLGGRDRHRGLTRS